MNWYVVNTKPHQEQRAAGTLEGLALETFCPMIRERRLIRRKMQTVTAPLFPGYLFAKFTLEEAYRKVSFARGVRRVVAFGSVPIPVSEDMIREIQDRLTESNAVLGNTRFLAKQPVHIQAGPLGGLEAIFERELSGQQRVVLLLRTLATQWRVNLPIEQVANQ